MTTERRVRRPRFSVRLILLLLSLNLTLLRLLHLLDFPVSDHVGEDAVQGRGLLSGRALQSRACISLGIRQMSSPFICQRRQSFLQILAQSPSFIFTDLNPSVLYVIRWMIVPSTQLRRKITHICGIKRMNKKHDTIKSSKINVHGQINYTKWSLTV